MHVEINCMEQKFNLVSPSYSIIVKYLPEVVPYFRKASVLTDIGWPQPDQTILNRFKTGKESTTQNYHTKTNVNLDSPDTTDTEPSSQTTTTNSSKSESKVIPLFGAFVRRIQMIKTLNNVQKNHSTAHSPESDYNSATADNSTSDSLNVQQVIVIHSPNLTKTCLIKFDNEIKTASWFRAINKTIEFLNFNVATYINGMDSFNYYNYSKICYLGWFLEHKTYTKSMVWIY